jgi:hypothetical protein
MADEQFAVNLAHNVDSEIRARTGREHVHKMLEALIDQIHADAQASTNFPPKKGSSA